MQLQLWEQSAVSLLAKLGRNIRADRNAGALALAVLLLSAVAVTRVVATYHIVNQTNDEPAHIATGMEWLEHGTYTMEPLHPPLARVAVALGPYLAGLRLGGQGDMWDEGNQIIFAQNRYFRNLSLARLGVLPFFLLATILVWYWARSRYGDGPALLGTLLFTSCPVVLAHAGVATTDMAIAATFMGALIAFINLLEKPTYFRFAVFSIALGFAILSKFSALVFIPACVAAVLLWRWLVLRGADREQAAPPARFSWKIGLALGTAVVVTVVWAGYRFSVGPIIDAERPHPTFDHLVRPQGAFYNLANSAAQFRWIPAPAFFRGMGALGEKQATGHKGYLLGQIRETGWWYFFPVAIASKTTIPFLIFILIGSFYLGRSAWREKNWVLGTPVVAAAALLVACMPSQINIGVRHILPIYPLFGVIGGVGAYRLWNSLRLKYVGMALAGILLVWHLTASFRCHPDYLAYFNEFAGHHPEKILIDSDLDWGQDLFRLASVLKQKHVDEVSIAYAGSADLSQSGLPPFHILHPYQPTAGWVAISLLRLKSGGRQFPNDSFAWLEAYNPVCLVGHSIRLYYVPNESVEKRGEELPSSKDRAIVDPSAEKNQVR